jgi:arsenate reductase (thioredoxin)
MRRTKWQRSILGVVGVGVMVLLSFGGARSFSAAGVVAFQNTSSEKSTSVLFMCPHGAAKSVLASAYFQRFAKERGLNVRVETAGIEPEEVISPVVASHLREKGYTVPVGKPRAATRGDVDVADVVISMGCDLSGLPVPADKLRRWDDVPGPSEDFKAADEAIRRRVVQLVDELLARKPK